MNMLEAMQTRHSVRQYTDQAIEPEKRQMLEQLIQDINAETGLHIQIFFDEPECFNSMLAHYGKFSNVKNYICLVGKQSDALEETLGYYGEKIVLQAQMMDLRTCWVAMTHGKSKADIRKNEKQVCLLSLGYGETDGVAHQNKPLERVCKNSENAPEWFLNGVNAALLAPTAMNQQKFCFTWQDDGTVKLSRGMGFYSKTDSGIVKYHFELGSGRKLP